MRLADRICSELGIGYAPDIDLTQNQWDALAVEGWSDEKLEELKELLLG